MKTKQEIGSRVRVIRLKLKLSQSDLAKYLGVSNTAVSSYETGDAYPSVPSLMKLVQLGNVTVDWLILGHEVITAELGQVEIKLVKYFMQATSADQEAILRIAENAAKVATLANRP